MKRSVTFASSIGSVVCREVAGGPVELPVIPGILKHPTPGELPPLLQRPDVALLSQAR